MPPPRSARESEDEDEEEEERRQSSSRGCTLQYQHATLQVFTQFHTTSSEGTDQVVTMLGPDWLVEVTDLVSDFMRVGDPRVARLVDSSTLAGLEPGTTPFKVGTRAVPGALLTCGQRMQTFLGIPGPRPPKRTSLPACASAWCSTIRGQGPFASPRGRVSPHAFPVPSTSHHHVVPESRCG